MAWGQEFDKVAYKAALNSVAVGEIFEFNGKPIMRLTHSTLTASAARDVVRFPETVLKLARMATVTASSAKSLTLEELEALVAQRKAAAQ